MSSVYLQNWKVYGYYGCNGYPTGIKGFSNNHVEINMVIHGYGGFSHLRHFSLGMMGETGFSELEKFLKKQNRKWFWKCELKIIVWRRLPPSSLVFYFYNFRVSLGYRNSLYINGLWSFITYYQSIAYINVIMYYQSSTYIYL